MVAEAARGLATGTDQECEHIMHAQIGYKLLLKHCSPVAKQLASLTPESAADPIPALMHSATPLTRISAVAFCMTPHLALLAEWCTAIIISMAPGAALGTYWRAIEHCTATAAASC